MYKMSEYEFRQYLLAEDRLKGIREQQKIELQQAYDDIHPTRAAFDYNLGMIYQESVDPVKYAMYLIELKEEHHRRESWWKLRADIYRQAFQKLSNDEQTFLNSPKHDYNTKRENALKKIREILNELITNRPDVQRPSATNDVFAEMEEADKQVEKMSMRELLEDYQDFIGEPNEPKKTGQKICDKKPSFVSDVATSYLSPEELTEYRNGSRGGSKWCSYDEYSRMKEKGMSLKEIAAKLEIKPSLLSKRVKYWKAFKENHNDAAII